MDLDSLARAQHGVLTRAQVLERDVTAEALRWRVHTGAWRVVHPGVLCHHSGPLDWLGRASAALLRLGPDSALCLTAAAYVLGFEDSAPQVIPVALPHAQRRHRVPGTRVTRRRRLTTTTRRGLAVTTPAQTVVDLAASPGRTRQDAVAVVARAVQRKKVTVDAVVAELGERRTHQHRLALELALGVVAAGAESVLEVAFHERVIRRHGLPPMTMAVRDTMDRLAIRRDFLEERHGLIVEVDGRIGHSEAERDRDNLRDRRAARAGALTLRAGWADVELEPCELALDVHGTLVNRGYQGPLGACGPGCRAVGANRCTG